MVTDAPLSHAGIIDREGGPTKVGIAIVEPANNVKAWKRNDSIPSAYWQKLVDAGLATYKELAAHAALKVA